MKPNVMTNHILISLLLLYMTILDIKNVNIYTNQTHAIVGNPFTRGC